jgi:hypothetical protein
MSMRFISVVRQGLSNGLKTDDAPAATLANADLALAQRITVQATLGTAAPAVPLQLLGPGDVTGIDPALVLRMDPPPGAQRADTSLFPLVEFDLPALPWMFTPVRAVGERLRPWIALVVVAYGKDEESPLDLTPLHRGRLPVLKVAAAGDLPPIDQTWAWAHAQVATEDAAATVESLVADRPETGQSRLLCPRRLDPDLHYVAAVVPTFEAGRLAGLGRPPADPATLAPAWGVTATAFPLDLPVYHHWEFFSAEAGNFEQAVRRLRGTDPPAAGGRVLDVSHPGHAAVEDPTPLPLAGALRPEALKIAAHPVKGFETLTKTGQTVTDHAGRTYPLVSMPLYAGRHTGATDIAGARAWVGELNSDPRHRVAAGLGAQIVRANQEALMRSAWEQAGDVEEANRRLRAARHGRAASKRIVERHIAALEGADRLRVLAPGFGRLGLPASDRTLAGLVAESRLPELLLGPSFTALTRPGGRIGRHLVKTPAVVPGIVEGIDEGTLQPDRGELGRPGGLVTLDGVLALVDAARESVRLGGDRTEIELGAVPAATPRSPRLTTAVTGEGRRATTIRLTDGTGTIGATTTLRGDFALPAAAATRRITPADLTSERVLKLTGTVELEISGTKLDVTDAHRTALAELFSPVDAGPVKASPALEVDTFADRALTAVEPGSAIARAVLALLDLPADDRDDELDDVLASPQFPAPLARELIRLVPELVLPGLDEVERDRVFAVVSNNPFVQALLAGANHEMMRELRWRGYPTDERGTAFHRFWREDADEIPDLHTIRTGALGAAVLGGVQDVVVVVRSDLLARFPGTLVYAAGASGSQPQFDKVALPVFRGTLAPDVAYFGFAFDAASATAGDGRFLVFQEPLTSPSFGLDVPDPLHPAPAWPVADPDDLAWSNVPQAGGFVDAEPATRPAYWGVSAADQAIATYQRPVRAAIHFRELIGGRP